MAFSANLLLTEPPTGDPAQTNNWANMVNTNMSLLDTAVAGSLPLPVTGGNLVLTSVAGGADQSRNAHFSFTGALASNELVLMPAGLSRMFSVANNCTGAFPLTFGVNDGSGSAAAGTTVTVPQGTTLVCLSDGTNIKIRHTGLPPTRTVYLSGSGNYSPPSGCIQIRIRMTGGGGGGGANSGVGTNGSAGTASSFNGVTANPGVGGGSNGAGGSGGTSGSGSPTGIFRSAGGDGVQATNVAASGVTAAPGGAGGSNAFGGQGAVGSGGRGGIASSIGAGNSGGGGGASEYVEFFISNPSGPYAYVVGPGGAVASGSSGASAGADGAIIIDEIY